MNEATVVDMNPFRNAPVAAAPTGESLMATVGSAREVAEVQTSMLMARRFPRDEVAAVDRILQACTRPTLAEGALYQYARGGTDIQGPSIRLAECIAQYWGHLDFGWRVLEERPGVTKVQSFCWDLQTGVKSQVVFDVEHQRLAKGKMVQLHDPRDIYEHVANAASRRLRACILRTIPGDVVEAAVKQCETTLNLKVQVTPERIQDMVVKFAEFGVTQAQLEKRVQRRLDTITPGQLVQLGKIYTSIRDGLGTPANWFEMPVETPPLAGQEGPGAPPAQPATPNPRQAVRDRLQARRQNRPEPEPTPTGSPALQDIMRFAQAARDATDLERVRQIALTLTDEGEVKLAQEYIDAAVNRII